MALVAYTFSLAFTSTQIKNNTGSKILKEFILANVRLEEDFNYENSNEVTGARKGCSVFKNTELANILFGLTDGHSIGTTPNVYSGSVGMKISIEIDFSIIE